MPSAGHTETLLRSSAVDSGNQCYQDTVHFLIDSSACGWQRPAQVPCPSPTGSSSWPPSFHFESAETPTRCHCERLAGDILADVPAGYELLFLFVFLLNQSASLSPERTTLQGNPENHRCLLRRAMLFPCASLERGSSAAGGGSCSPWRDRSPA